MQARNHIADGPLSCDWLEPAQSPMLVTPAEFVCEHMRASINVCRHGMGASSKDRLAIGQHAVPAHHSRVIVACCPRATGGSYQRAATVVVTQLNESHGHIMWLFVHVQTCAGISFAARA